MRARAMAACALMLGACVGPADVPSNVHDLRVLGESFEPPELMAPTCDTSSLANFAVFTSPLQFKALIADPAGQGRPIAWELWACANPNDRTCTTPTENQLLASGQTAVTNGLDEELTMTVQPGAVILSNGPADGGPEPLLLQVIQDDPYHGLGGILMPVVLHLRAGAEEIYAQKLMVFSCQFFPQMKPNQTPVLRGFQLAGVEWPNDGGTVRAQGAGSIQVQADDISDLEESYVVPGFDLKPVSLVESWKIDYYTTLGTFSPDETGGTNLDGSADPNTTAWSLPSGATEQDVNFWFVVRDGRGGESWTQRKLHYVP